MLALESNTLSRKRLAELLAEARARTILLVSPVPDDSLNARPDPAVRSVLQELGDLLRFEDRWLAQSAEDPDYLAFEPGTYDEWFDAMVELRQRSLERLELMHDPGSVLSLEQRCRLVLEHEYKQFADDEVRDIRNSLDDWQWRSKANGSITWNQGDWTATIYGNRYGSLPKSDGSGRIAPYMTYNASMFRQFGENLTLGVIVNNLRDSRPPADKNGGGWPFYPVGNYDPYGRQFWVQLDYRFR